ncbi:hypothetical protein [Mucilaginibacter antarcticus]|uniref:Beta-lactamase regulating signal transducer with metallopeptidase domain n=1 Tax=Mucilaginibacter antarcticus TaxID=1855725 RepID=A0ABW5XUP3_9SPHI
MGYPIIIIPYLNVDGMAIYPFILLKKADHRRDAVLIRHETIHLKQQQEMLVLPFYMVYLIIYLFNLFRFKNHDRAYKAIIFEREAYSNDREPGYVTNRPFWAFLNCK